MDERTRAGWALTVAVAIGGFSLLFVAGPTLQTLLVAVVAAAATFLALELPGAWRRRRPRR